MQKNYANAKARALAFWENGDIDMAIHWDKVAQYWALALQAK
jgi:hypothetical protein